MKHTITPWEDGGYRDRSGRGVIFGFNRMPVLIYDGETKDRDIKYMLKAVNSHEYLVKALKFTIDQAGLDQRSPTYKLIESVLLKAKGES